MSLFGKIGKLIGKVAPVLSVIPGVGPVARAVGAAAGALSKVRPIQQSLPLGTPPFLPTASAAALGASLPAVLRTGGAVARRVIKSPVGRIAGGVAAGVAVGELVDQFGRPIQKKRRRMNPCNDKALRRALRRIESYDRLRKRVDKSLRKACPPRRTPSRRKVC